MVSYIEQVLVRDDLERLRQGELRSIVRKMLMPGASVSMRLQPDGILEESPLVMSG
jgi:hypothetical protein